MRADFRCIPATRLPDWASDTIANLAAIAHDATAHRFTLFPRVDSPFAECSIRSPFHAYRMIDADGHDVGELLVMTDSGETYVNAE